MSLASKERARVNALKARYRADPVLFFKEVLGITTLEPYQEKTIREIAANKRIVIKACHDVGKSFIMARILIWFMVCFVNSKVISTAPTFNQVQNILWNEVRAAVGKALYPLGGELNLTEWKLGPEWFALGFTATASAGSGDDGQGKQSSFQGFHAEHILVIFDEATGIKKQVWDMAEGMLTSASVKFVAIANPTSRESEFYRCFKKAGYHKIGLSCFDSPNLKVNGFHTKADLERECEELKGMSDAAREDRLKSYKIVSPYLLCADWVVAKLIDWGFTHPLSLSKIFGEFPEGGADVAISLGMVEAAQANTIAPLPSDRKSLGVDVARYGADSTVLTFVHGQRQISKQRYQHKDNLEVAGYIINFYRENLDLDVICIDETGMPGVVDAVRQAQRERIIDRKVTIRAVKFGSTEMPEKEKVKYVNVKARIFGLTEEWFKRGAELLPDSVYLDELPSIRYLFNSKGQKYIESKDEFKKRTGRGSPDHADSLALAIYGLSDEIQGAALTDDFIVKGPRLSSGAGGGRPW